MKYFDDMPYEDMADVLGVAVGTLKATYHNAVKNRRKSQNSGYLKLIKPWKILTINIKENPFTVPEGYFDELTGRITGRIEKQKEVKKVLLFAG